jgi:hypothetical protein
LRATTAQTAARLAPALEPRYDRDPELGKEDLVENVQAGLETRGFELGPLSHREAAIAWSAEWIRADLA